MNFEKTAIEGVLIVGPNIHEDPRGTFMRIHCREEFAANGVNASTPAQCSVSYNHKRGTVRGLHYQLAPFNEAKLVVCLTGRMFDAIVDLRKSSPTFGKSVGLYLSPGRNAMAYVPEGCAHGFQTLEDNTTLLYIISEPYSPSAARGLRWDDPVLGLQWPLRELAVVSERDSALPYLSELDHSF